MFSQIVVQQPFVDLEPQLTQCSPQDKTCNTPPGSFHVGDVITVGMSWSPGLMNSFGIFQCEPFNYPWFAMGCRGDLEIAGDIGNPSEGPPQPGSCNILSDPFLFSSTAYITSYSQPGIHTVAANVFACQASPDFQHEVPTGMLLASTTLSITVLPNTVPLYIQGELLSPSGSPTAPLLTTDPAAQTAHVPLGSTFQLTLEQQNTDGSFSPIPSTFSFTEQATVPLVTLPSLFPNSVVIEYAGSTNQEAILQAVHKGTATLHIVPEDANLLPVDVGISVEDPASLGTTHPEVDPFIYPYANATGIPPQYIKAQMAQESGNQFNPTAYRYEPFSKDDLEVSRGQDLRIVDPYALYRFATLADSQDAALPQGAQLSPADISPRSVFQICANNACTNLTNIPPNAQYVSALQIVLLNDWFWHWTDCTGCVDRTDELQNDDFTAQTAVAASYGYMQVLFETAIAPMQWQGVNGNRNPSYLLDTADNMAVGGGSLNLGTSYLQRLCWKAGDANFSPDGDVVTWQGEGDLRSAFQIPWSRYNGGNPAYATKVSDRVQSYLPNSANAIFGATQ